MVETKEAVKLPTGAEWLEIFRQAGVDIDGVLRAFEAEIDSYVQKLPEDPVLRKQILDQLDEETRRIIESGEPLHTRIDSLTSILRNAVTSQQVQAMFYMATEELVKLVRTGKSSIKKRGTRLA